MTEPDEKMQRWITGTLWNFAHFIKLHKLQIWDEDEQEIVRMFMVWDLQRDKELKK